MYKCWYHNGNIEVPISFLCYCDFHATKWKWFYNAPFHLNKSTLFIVWCDHLASVQFSECALQGLSSVLHTQLQYWPVARYSMFVFCMHMLHMLCACALCVVCMCFVCNVCLTVFHMCSPTFRTHIHAFVSHVLLVFAHVSHTFYTCAVPISYVLALRVARVCLMFIALYLAAGQYCTFTCQTKDESKTKKSFNS